MVCVIITHVLHDTQGPGKKLGIGKIFKPQTCLNFLHFLCNFPTNPVFSTLVTYHFLWKLD